jgi:hypothetical protein
MLEKATGLPMTVVSATTFAELGHIPLHTATVPSDAFTNPASTKTSTKQQHQLHINYTTTKHQHQLKHQLNVNINLVQIHTTSPPLNIRD